MHPILGDPRRLGIYLLLWLLIGLLLTIGLRGDTAWTTAAAFFLPLCFLYAFVCLSAWYICRFYPLEKGARLINATVVYVVAATIASGSWVLAGGFWALALDNFAGGFAARRLFDGQQLLLLVVGALLFFLAAAAGRSDALGVVQTVAEKLGQTLATIVDLLNPEVIVVGSIFVRQHALIWPTAEKVLRREALSPALAKCRVLPAALGEELGDYAALALAAERAAERQPS